MTLLNTRLVVILLLVILWPGLECLKIGSFNVKMFGQKKMQDNNVVNILVECHLVVGLISPAAGWCFTCRHIQGERIIQRYDIVLIQEIRDKSGKAIEDLLERVNDGDYLFDVEMSELLGRTKSKEQFAFFYRVDRDIAVADMMHWDDSRDLFERNPFAVRFEVPHCDMPEFVLVAVHVDPDDAEQEIDALVAVKEELQRRWFADSILFMGDLNADCRYFTDAAKDRSALTTDEYFWWIADDQDTTVSSTECALDRFVMFGDEFIDSVQCETAAVFRFDDEYNMTNEDALKVSDHYPIEMELRECSAVNDRYYDDEL